MSLVVESFSSGQQTVGSGALGVTAPAGIVDGNLILVFREEEDESAAEGLAGPTLVTPAGFTALHSASNYGNYHSAAAYARIASGEPGSYSFTVSAQDIRDSGIIILRISGHDPVIANYLLANTNKPIPNTANIDAPSVVAVADQNAVFRVCGPARGTAPAAPAGTTSVAAINVTFAASLQVARADLDVGPGAVGTVTFITDGLGSQHALTLVIPVVAAGGGSGAGGTAPVRQQHLTRGRKLGHA